MMKSRYLVLPLKPSDAREVIEAIYRAWDHYRKPENKGVLGSAEAERIYRELYAIAADQP
jgi:hypothetical protein